MCINWYTPKYNAAIAPVITDIIFLLLLFLAIDSKHEPIRAQHTMTSAIETGKACMNTLNTIIGSRVLGF